MVRPDSKDLLAVVEVRDPPDRTANQHRARPGLLAIRVLPVRRGRKVFRNGQVIPVLPVQKGLLALRGRLEAPNHRKP